MPTHKDLPIDLPPDEHEWRSTYGVPLAEAFNTILTFLVLLALVLSVGAIAYVFISTYVYVMTA
jgi:hypothetical protein